MGRLRRGVKRLLLALGIDLHMRTEDRRVLQAEILPWLSGLHRGGRVLFVGCEWYTRGYRRWFDPDGYRTMDIDPAKAAHGATQHVTDSMANMAHHFPAGSLDLVICNGVIGWGLDDPADIEAALSATHTALRPGGLLLLGWNDVPEHTPVPLDRIAALRSFERADIVPCGSADVLTTTEDRHTYSLFRKAGEPSGDA